MTLTPEYLKERAYFYLTECYGEGAEFRDGQYEAIEATLLHNRTLVVQKTGWGKSIVYFIATKIIRENHGGAAVVISPLLALMENQMEAAEKAGLKCKCIHSRVSPKERLLVLKEWAEGVLDMLLVTPESLFSADLKAVYSKEGSIGFFVVDEAHCISDWGHDFRFEYGMLNRVLEHIPPNVPVLATTATANERVTEDMKVQLGGDVFVLRGSLMRRSLSIQVLPLASKAERYGWLLEHLPSMEGAGIVYALTTRDCDNLANFLREHDIEARPYHGQRRDCEETEALFKENKIKVLVATIKLGMGYDKGDIAFVVNFQMPSNIVSYYQQIGRAGRSIPRANTYLMTGLDDVEIQNYFIERAFPSQEESTAVYKAVEKGGRVPVEEAEVLRSVNLMVTRSKKALAFLVKENILEKIKQKPLKKANEKADEKANEKPKAKERSETIHYRLTSTPYTYNNALYERVTRLREEEQEQFREFIQTTECYSRFVVNALDDMETDTCGICANCNRTSALPLMPKEETLQMVKTYLDAIYFPIVSRKQYPNGDYIPNYNNIKTGIALAKYGEAGYGQWVKEDKYGKDVERYRKGLVIKSANVMREKFPMERIEGICFVPSLRCQKVARFAEDLSKELDLPLLNYFYKTPSGQQKFMENSEFQYRNARDSLHFAGVGGAHRGVILVDDVVDSKWTLTVCGEDLVKMGWEAGNEEKKGCEVYPFALADSGKQGG